MTRSPSHWLSAPLAILVVATACGGGAPPAESERGAQAPAETAAQRAAAVETEPPTTDRAAEHEPAVAADDLRLVLSGREYGELALLAFGPEGRDGLANTTVLVVPHGTSCEGTIMLTDMTGRTAASPSDTYVSHRIGPVPTPLGTFWRGTVPGAAIPIPSLMVRQTEGHAEIIDRSDRGIRVRFDLRTNDGGNTLVGEAVARVCPGDPF